MLDLNFKYKNLISFLNKNTPFKPELSIILGSGLGQFAEGVKIHKTILTTSIPCYPASTIEGHAGKIHFAEYKREKIIALPGKNSFL